MNNGHQFEAELYALGNTATVITEGYAFQTRNDASLKTVSNSKEIKATKFGIYEIGPQTVQKRREEYEERAEIFDRVDTDAYVRLYNDQNYYYIPTPISRPFDQEDFVVYDQNDNILYHTKYDDVQNGSYNLIGTSKNTIKKVNTNTLENQMHKRYNPMIRINKNR